MHQATKDLLEILVPLVHAEEWDAVDSHIDSKWASRHLAKKALAKVGVGLPQKKSDQYKMARHLAELVRSEDWDAVEVELDRKWERRADARRHLRKHHGLDLPRKKSMLTANRKVKRSRSLEVVADLLNRPELTLQAIGDNRGCTRQYVELIKSQAKMSGIQIEDKEL